MNMKHLPVLLLACVLMLLVWAGPALADGVYFADQSLPAAMVGVYYHTRVKIVGDSIPYVVSLTTNPAGDNDFPSELAITEDGVIYGTPLHEGVFPFSLQVAYGTDQTRFCVTKLVVKPFSQDALKQGGLDTDIIGEGNDSLTGVANGINGGRVTMEAGGDTAYFISSKYKLYAAERPYTKATELFSAPEYRWLDSIGSNLYYYHRYYDEPDPVYTTVIKGSYVTRICRDPIGSKGRVTLVELSKKDILDLAVTDRIILYIVGKDRGTITRIPLNGGKAVSIRCYSNAKELQADMVFPYNGYAYFRSADNGLLYRVALDGETAQPVTDVKAGAYTIASPGGEDTLFFADAGGALFRIPLEGGEKGTFGSLKAGALNSDADFLYFANASDHGRLYSVPCDDPEAAVMLTDFAVDQIYVFESMLAVQKKGGQELYVLSKDGTGKPVRIWK